MIMEDHHLFLKDFTLPAVELATRVPEPWKTSKTSSSRAPLSAIIFRFFLLASGPPAAERSLSLASRSAHFLSTASSAAFSSAWNDAW